MGASRANVSAAVETNGLLQSVRCNCKFSGAPHDLDVHLRPAIR